MGFPIFPEQLPFTHTNKRPPPKRHSLVFLRGIKTQRGMGEEESARTYSMHAAGEGKKSRPFSLS
jgi:hypothetical protein